MNTAQLVTAVHLASPFYLAAVSCDETRVNERVSKKMIPLDKMKSLDLQAFLSADPTSNLGLSTAVHCPNSLPHIFHLSTAAPSQFINRATMEGACPYRWLFPKADTTASTKRAGQGCTRKAEQTISCSSPFPSVMFCTPRPLKSHQ